MFLEALKQYQASWPRLREAANGNGDALAKGAAATESHALFEKAKQQLMADINFNVDGAAKMKIKSREALSDSNRYIASTLLVILLLGSGFAIWLRRSITEPLQRAMPKKWPPRRSRSP